jgi:hypothetical protein
MTIQAAEIRREGHPGGCTEIRGEETEIMVLIND